MQVRIQKFLSNAGVASRRKAEALIKDGKVQVNGRKATIGESIDTDSDIITVNGKYIDQPDQLFYMLLNKPKRYVTTREDRFAKKTVFDLLPKEFRKVVWPVGRLDSDTEGLLLLTNDGELTQTLTHPGYAHEKEYELTLETMPTAKQLRDLRSGVMIKGTKTEPAKAAIRNNKVHITLTEGKKHQIRLMCKAVGLQLTNLKRVRVGKARMPKGLKPGAYLIVKKSDII